MYVFNLCNQEWTMSGRRGLVTKKRTRRTSGISFVVSGRSQSVLVDTLFLRQHDNGWLLVVIGMEKVVVVLVPSEGRAEKSCPLGSYYQDEAFMNIGKCYGAKVMPIIGVPVSRQFRLNILLFVCRFEELAGIWAGTIKWSLVDFV